MKMRVTITGTYETTDNPSDRIEYYGTTDPAEMAAVDAQNDVSGILALMDDASVSIIPEV